MASQLDDKIGGANFISMMEDDLNPDLFGQTNELRFALPMSALDNGLFLGGLEDTVDNNNTQ